MRGMLTQSPSAFAVFGHRGASGLAPENTLASFARAVALGVDGVELDVRLTSDGEVVVLHDERLERTTSGVGLVGETSFRALRRLDAGNGEKVPTLAEVFDRVPAHVAVNVELKAAGTALAVAEVLEQTAHPLLVSSFDHAELGRFHSAMPRVACAPLAARWRERLTTVAASLDACAINLAERAATPRRLAALAERGFGCLVYTIDNARRAEQLRTDGAAGVFTNRPDRVLGSAGKGHLRLGGGLQRKAEGG